MDTGPPPPPLFSFGTTTDTAIPKMYYSSGTATNGIVSNYLHSIIIIIIIVLASMIIVTTSVYFLVRLFSRNAVVSQYRNENEHGLHHVISVPNNNEQKLDCLPVVTFSSIILNNNEQQLDCAVCLSKFEAKDHLRRLPCFHAFHVECIDSWLKCNQTCPLCRSTINPSEADIMNKTAASDGGNSNMSNSLCIEIGTISRVRYPTDSNPGPAQREREEADGPRPTLPRGT